MYMYVIERNVTSYKTFDNIHFLFKVYLILYFQKEMENLYDNFKKND